ncbi:hypothetical protein Dda_6071 [Drechslerella dactyloides]|uniref:Uncharacterized protein n=1 Tax=Drechslerella dactyloides TaxID=74499 RepID=A0AAD6IUV9_DREDA|nr:hypothetical protein Dda_6071 [Drechslerella dactyloides]
MAKLKVDPALIAAAQATVVLDSYADWTARRVATYSRVLETALAKIKREVELASYSARSVSTVAFKQLFTAPEPASKWEWDPKTEHDLANEVHVRRATCQQPRKQGYADASASRRKGIALHPRRPVLVKNASSSNDSSGGGSGSVFDNYLQNPTLRRNMLIAGANPAVRPHYATILQQHASIVAPRDNKNNSVDNGNNTSAVPSLAVLSARAFGRAIVMARDAEDLQGDYSWYSYCDEDSCMYYLLTETLRGHITQLLCDALAQEWFPPDLASTLIAQSVHAGDSSLTETLFRAAYHGSFEQTRSIARRKGELAPDPFSHILYMPDVLFRQLGLAIDDRPEIMLDAWYRDVMFAGIGEIGTHAELPRLTTMCLELLLGIEVWEDGVHRRRLNRSGKTMRKKYESFDKAWLFQTKEAVQSKAADVAQDLMERLFEVGWGALDVTDETRTMARAVMRNLVRHMISWAHAFNHPHKEASEGSSITARTLALCAVLLSHEDDPSLSVREVAEELVRLLLVTMIEASEGQYTIDNGYEAADTFDLPDLAGYIAGVVGRVYESPAQQQSFVESLLHMAIGETKPRDFTQTPAAGDKTKLQQKRQSYVIAIFAYHLATCLAESSKSEAAHAFAAQVEQRLVGLRISKKGLLKASDLKTPKFSNLIRDLAMSEARSNRWVYEPMLNEWVEVPGTVDNKKKTVSRKLNFAQHARKAGRPRAVEETTILRSHESGDEPDIEGEGEDTTVYPASTDTTMDVDSPLPNVLVAVSIPTNTAPVFSLTSSSTAGDKISRMFSQCKIATRGVKRRRGSDSTAIFSGAENPAAKSADKDTPMTGADAITITPATPRRKRGRPKRIRTPKSKVTTIITEDSAYEPDDEDDETTVSHRSKRRRTQDDTPTENTVKRGRGRPRLSTNAAANASTRKIDVYQDELDLITARAAAVTVRSRSASRVRSGKVFGSTNNNKLNAKVGRRSSGGRKGYAQGRGRPRGRVAV